MSYGLINEMFEQKMKLIHKYLIKLGCSQDNAEDIVQDTFYKALKYIDGIQADKMSSWLFKVAINKYYDLCRKNNRHIHMSIDEDIFKESLSDSKLVEDFILDLEQKEEILKVLNSISDIHKNLLVFKYEMGLSYKEISELLDINENTVKTYLSRAREQFKKVWRDRYEK
ncbi:DNA-directed RNA polymerase sigma-70 factor [Clostridium zeae]|uniref:DNA-directed RNA polymerase sigma-70 factor n=1 Tax=Clostridium zeae TaxID=2759022 RepID=A0ABQ1EDU8_9CLOT|nr:RNA polymerase sigma factor [Clostridium zeae]GFZ32989.1 DNA-directed RNA polymerase sigma-70 factor [Clostridium zeae]